MLKIKQELQVKPNNVSCWSLSYGEPVLMMSGDDWSLQVILTEEQLKEIGKGVSQAIKTRAEKAIEKANEILDTENE